MCELPKSKCEPSIHHVNTVQINGFLASLKLPSYEEVAAQPSTPPPPYSSVFTTPRYPQPPRAAEPHLLTQHGPLLHRPLSDGPSSLSSDNSSSLSAPVTYETDTSHATTPSEATPLTLDVTMETIAAAASFLEVNEAQFVSERMLATVDIDTGDEVSAGAQEHITTDSSVTNQIVSMGVVTRAVSPHSLPSPSSEVALPVVTTSPIKQQLGLIPCTPIVRTCSSSTLSSPSVIDTTLPFIQIKSFEGPVGLETIPGPEITSNSGPSTLTTSNHGSPAATQTLDLTRTFDTANPCANHCSTFELYPSFDPSTFEPYPSFDPSTFEPYPSFDPSTFEPYPSFDPSTFEPYPNFDPSTFKPYPSFDPSTFEPYPNFDPSTFKPYPSFDPSTFKPYPNFDPSTFKPYPNFDLSTFKLYPNFDPSTFKPYPSFDPSTFKPYPSFDPSTFKPYPNFDPSTFKPYPSFDPSTFKPYPSFDPSTFKPYPSFDPSTFKPYPSFDPSTFKPYPSFDPSTFKPYPNFDPSTFKPYPSFDPSTFKPYPSFDPSTFKPYPNFDPSTFKPYPSFDPSTFKPYPSFDPSTFKPYPSFDPSTFKPYPSFDPSTFKPYPSFDPSTFKPYPNFDPSTFKPYPSFDPSTFKPYPSFDPSTFKPYPNFDPSTFKPYPRFDPCTFKPYPRFDRAPALLLDPLTALHQSNKGGSSSGHASSLSPSPRATQSPPKQTLFSPCVDVFEPGPPSWEVGEEEQEEHNNDDDEDDMGADESQYRHRRLTGDSGIEVCRCRVEDEEEEEEGEEEEKRKEIGRRGGGVERDKKVGGNTDLHDSVDCPARGQITTGEGLVLCNPTSTTTPASEDGGKVVIVMETM
ncbi:Protein PBMUCL2 HLA complex group 22 [Collichthys lucidus]|uniref:Protein PBMUCL2 HLA complex group 22 n=1 Tax=Collichthys lucidus TaxID=240159 RepID=A0A4U5W079_COLLU|nr:Protein PBMUCL2 HLA complex group 22 [Collichthys lucidus]